MNVAFVTGALAAGVAGATLATAVIWVLTVVTGSGDPWRFAPWVVAAVGVLFAAVTYLGERWAHDRTVARRRATGEPWAFRDR
jgi:hypothetical protein